MAGGCSGLLAGATMAVLRTSAPRVFTNLTTGRALPLVVVSVLAGATVLILLVLDRVRLIRPLAAFAVATVAAGWTIAQYPYLLPPHLTIAGSRGGGQGGRGGHSGPIGALLAAEAIRRLRDRSRRPSR